MSAQASLPYKMPRRSYSLLGSVPLLLGMAVLGIIIIFLTRRPDIHPDLIFGDLSDFIDTQRFHESYIGLVSQMGSFFWFSGAAMCGLTALVSLKVGFVPKRRARYLAALALVGLWLGMDDMLLLHDHLLPVYLHLDEKIILIAYLIVLPLTFLYFWREVLAHQFPYFLLFAGLVAFSQGVDFIRPDTEAFVLQTIPTMTIVEEGSKFLGLIAFWTYCLLLSVGILSDGIKSLKTAG